MADNESNNRYDLRGVSASKEDVHAAIKNIDKGLFPKAFCKVVPDYLTNDEDYCIVMHADGAGTATTARNRRRHQSHLEVATAGAIAAC